MMPVPSTSLSRCERLSAEAHGAKADENWSTRMFVAPNPFGRSARHWCDAKFLRPRFQAIQDARVKLYSAGQLFGPAPQARLAWQADAVKAGPGRRVAAGVGQPRGLPDEVLAAAKKGRV